MDTNFHVHRVLDAVSPGIMSVHPSNSCPPPSRIFHGRQTILDQMHNYFACDSGKQQIFLLHGLGGAGKTQIALKFIEQSSWQNNLAPSSFSEVFLIDTSSTDTIDSGLKNVAVSKDIGYTSQDALQWLISKHDEWLLFFDNADNPRINLNTYIPLCNHGNILITSRNPGLRVYAGSHCHVSDMEESDAAELLLKSAAEDSTQQNKQMALEIVKELSYLPLAIIQAGAFISKSGVLKSYLTLYATNRTKLLSEKPIQSHDDYAWTAYTTWQISFEQLSPPAATLLQLCSFLHHRGISEEIFRNASSYKFRTLGPSREELQKPLDFLAQFLGPTGGWDSRKFIDVTAELRAYSLINMDPETEMFALHPLVHKWSQSTIVDHESLRASAVALVGMSVAQLPREHKQLTSIRLLPHIDSLLQGETYITPDFNLEYGELYYCSGCWQRAKDLQIMAFEKSKRYLGEDHPATMEVMESLALTYCSLGNLKEAEEFQVLVLEKRRNCFGTLEKRRNSLGNNHLATINAMGNLATTYRNLGRTKEAYELDVLVSEKRRNLLGEDHPDTLRAMNELALSYHALGELTKAQELQAVIMEKRSNFLGEDHPGTLNTMGELAVSYHDLGEFQKAEKLENVVLAKRRKLEVELLEEHRNLFGDDHRQTLLCMRNLAWTYRHLGRLTEANQLTAVLEKGRDLIGDSDQNTLVNLGVTYR
ncbi:P-loop containing nucleoside triphosphate hydrolase protein [Mycena leptocephala]|nr:P-loop containing nucleoside triphosphate hydrolase protein [Mycena leptocephala]